MTLPRREVRPAARPYGQGVPIDAQGVDVPDPAGGRAPQAFVLRGADTGKTVVRL